ncbi:hypothetical protein BGX30_004732 [Mortierella sp. GBA39]|nr:hypothetical protein BGX30_004732 [Mortierella sp. GBA39]
MDDSSQGVVTREVWRGQIVVIKKPRQGQDVDESLRREAAILKDLADIHIIQFYAVEEDPFQVIMEDAEGGTLKVAIPSLLWENKRRIAGEIAHGLTYIHSQGIIHCDIKSLNVLLTKKLEVKICDFGCAMTTTDKKNKMPCYGTFEWRAPELLLDATAYSSKSDVYALGIVMWEMASGVVPSDRSQVLEQKLENVPEDYLVAMQNCWDQDPACRPETQDLSFMKYERGLNEEHERFWWAIRNGDMSRKAVTITVAQSVSTDVKVDFDVQKKTVNYTLVGLNDPVALKNTSTVESLLESANKGSDRSKAASALSYYESGRHSEALHFAQQVRHIPVACYVMGDLEGQYSLGVMIYYGCGVPLDRKEGERWIRKAADQGHKDAEAGMGIVCIHLKDYSGAMQWCLKAGNPISHYHIGVLYYNGWWGVEPNCAAAMEWFQKAADQRCGLAAFALAKMYREGEVGEKDMNMAMQLYRHGHKKKGWRV